MNHYFLRLYRKPNVGTYNTRKEKKQRLMMFPGLMNNDYVKRSNFIDLNLVIDNDKLVKEYMSIKYH